MDLSGISNRAYAELAPFTWLQNRRQNGGRFFGTGRFRTPDGRARMVAVKAALPPALLPELPFRLNTGPIRDQWHTMTRTARSPRLSLHLAEPFVELHPADAAKLNIGSADLVHVTNPQGQAILRALMTTRVAVGEVWSCRGLVPLL